MTTRTFFCALCNASVEHEAPQDSVHEGIAASMEHMRVLHPDVFAEIETWPDGAPVVVDESLAPDDFGPGDESTAGDSS